MSIASAPLCFCAASRWSAWRIALRSGVVSKFTKNAYFWELGSEGTLAALSLWRLDVHFPSGITLNVLELVYFAVAVFLVARFVTKIQRGSKERVIGGYSGPGAGMALLLLLAFPLSGFVRGASAVWLVAVVGCIGWAAYVLDKRDRLRRKRAANE
ncbi:MAG: hypothetical protein QOI34_1780 [Verrucomicrobiota bacterium]|jgi:hypothetical protein